jgi:hypothetical protein
MLQERFGRLPKPVILAVLGAVGAAAGALVGEVLPISDHHAGGGSQGSRSVITFSSETRKRLDREGAEEGEIELALSWGNRNDLDLHCITPNGEHIFFQNKRSSSGGYLDVDMNVSLGSASNTPVEHIRWKDGTAPRGEYQVYVDHYNRHVVRSDPTSFKVELKRGGRIKTVTGSLTYGPLHGRELVHTFVHPDNSGGFQMVILVGLWAGLVAIGTGIGLVIGQNSLLRRRLLSGREAGVIAAYGLVAGLASGGFGQAAYALVADIELLRWLGQVAGWTLLGGILAMGLSLFVPNLKLLRGLLGGLAGGGAGAIGFLVVGLVLGNVPARLVGAALLGLCIGAMIALIEAVFREAWLEVHYGPNEQRSVTLGKRPIAIGSNAEACTVFAQGVADVALRYTLQEGRITCEDVPSGRSDDVMPGDTRQVGNLKVVVCGPQVSSATPVQDTKPPGSESGEGVQPASPVEAPVVDADFILRIRGRAIPLSHGVRLTSEDVAGLETSEADGGVAQVSAHPSDPQILGLQNLATRAWFVTLPDGQETQIEPGRNVRLASGTKINFGVLRGEIEEP